MNYEEINALLEKYGWILESYSPLNIRSKNGESFAQNFAAEVVIEYFMLVDQSDDEDNREDLINRFNNEK
jgi:hypothetical protein